MFKCFDCKGKFELPIKDKEQIGERFGELCYEDVSYCPYCRSMDYKNICDDDCICDACITKRYTYEMGIEYLKSGYLHRINSFMSYWLDIPGLMSVLETGNALKIETYTAQLKDRVDGFKAVLKDYCLEEPQELIDVIDAV